jgi:hypothetical protein
VIWLKNGALLVDVFNEKQQMFSLRLNSLVLTLFTLTGVHPSIHPRGIVKIDIQDGMLDEEIQICLAHQFVSAGCKLIGKRNGKSFPLRTIFLTVEVPALPSSILVRYERVPVYLYVPNTMRCFWCQRFGHTQQRCVSSLVCGNCSEPGHGKAPCTSPPH